MNFEVPTAHELSKELIFVIFCLAVGLFLLYILSRSVATSVLFFGTAAIIFVALQCFRREDVKIMLEKYTWVTFSRDTIIHTILPALIFETVYTLDVHDFRTYRRQMVVLGVGVYLISFIIVGCATYVQLYLVSYIWPQAPLWRYRTCWIFAATACTVDPTAAISAFREVGLPHRLFLLMKGESIFSDAMALLFFDIISTILKFNISGSAQDLIPIIYFVFGSFGMVLIGYVFGRVASVLLERVKNGDATREGIVLVLFVYSNYAISKFIHGSGVLGLLTMALTLNGRRSYLHRSSFDVNKRLWTFLAYYSSCIMVPLTAFGCALHVNNLLILHGFLAYPVMVLSRYLAVVFLTPILHRMTGSFPVEYSCLLLWSGVRGAVSLALAWQPAVNVTDKYDPFVDDVLHLAPWMLGITVACGHLFQGATISRVATKLGLGGMTRTEVEQLKEELARMNERTKESINKRKLMPQYAGVDWATVERNTHLSVDDFPELTSATRDDLENVEASQSELRAREIIRRCYDSQLSKLLQFSAVSSGIDYLKHAIAEAARRNRVLNVDALYEMLQPYNFWQRLKYDCKGGIFRLIGPQFSASCDFWLLIVCGMAFAQACMIYYTCFTVTSTRKEMLLITGILTLFLCAEFMIRAWREHREKSWYKFWQNYSPFAWLQFAAALMNWILFALHITLYIYCRGKYEKLFDSAPMVGQIRTALLVCGSVNLLKLPFGVVFLIRLFCTEIENMLHAAEETTLEVLQVLISTSECVLRLLIQDELAIESAPLKNQLIQECRNVQEQAENKVIKWYNDQQSFKSTSRTINTQRIAYELLNDRIIFLETARRQGALGEEDFEGAMRDAEDLRERIAKFRSEDEVQPMSTELENMRALSWLRDRQGFDFDAFIQELKTKGIRKSFSAGHIVYNKGDTANGLYVLLDGLVRFETRLEAYGEAGVYNELCYAGIVFGNGSVAEKERRAKAMAVTKIETILLSKNDFKAFPDHLREALFKLYIEKRAVYYMQWLSGFRSWPKEMVHKYVKRNLKELKTDQKITVHSKPVILFQGTVVDKAGKEYKGDAIQPVRIKPESDSGEYQTDLVAKGEHVVYFVVQERSETFPTDEVFSGRFLATGYMPSGEEMEDKGQLPPPTTGTVEKEKTK